MVCSLEVSFLMTRGVLPKRSGLCRVSNPRPLNSVRQCQKKEENAPSEEKNAILVKIAEGFSLLKNFSKNDSESAAGSVSQ